MVAIVQREPKGRPAIVYGKPCSQREILHELYVTDFSRIYRDWDYSREARVGETMADALMTKDNQCALLELDCSGKLTKKQYEQKWESYRRCRSRLLVIAMNEPRMQRIRSWSKAVRNIALFTTFERLLADENEVAERWVVCAVNSTQI